ncbi:DUF2793 domain-containing protein [Aliishimia ponticola]|uniref:DUF2793 domain-containing protein n=1 Tax=Aliishimia ponticola TaxID=2499833 RepID=A0A4S4N8C7_9RHOB|nr:DUF2793 domain-containing protein [Aliishimia ponticola]THH35379.1 DUF2793 domain-containing protein [Aliishimia ponticola]
MSQNSLNLSLPFIQGGQAQKHVTHNEALRTLDTIVQLSVRDRVQAPDPTAVDGDRYIIQPGATGDFAGYEGQIAQFESGTWQFVTPKIGWVAYDQSSGSQIAYDGTGWLTVGGGVSSATASDRFGINTTADTVNRLAVSADATLLSHDIGGGHQLKLNKQSDIDTASLLFQTGWSGRAEMGITGSDDFEIKVSADGTAFHTALRVDRNNGAVSLPNTLLSDPAFGASPLVTQDYTTSRGGGMVTNSTGHLGNTYNYPASFTFDPLETPNMPGSFSKAGYYSGVEEMAEFVALDPNRLYRLGVYIRQESVAGDWSAFANEERHVHYMGFRCYDSDGLTINAAHHTRYHHGGIDSMTTLDQPLAPGDTELHLTDASGWNESTSSSYERGIVIFGYKNSLGKTYEFYSRIEEIDMFDLGSVDKANHKVLLKQPLPAALGNPDDPAGVWPAGTKIANRSSGWNYKFGFFSDLVVDATDAWYRVENAMGGVDLSGRNVPTNFPPGTAQVRPVWLLNYSNRAGGYSTYPDTGSTHRVWVTGVSVAADQSGAVIREADGSCSLRVVQGDAQTGTVSFDPATVKIVPA